MIVTNENSFHPDFITSISPGINGFIQEPGPIFGAWCSFLSQRGLIVIPTGGDDGKRPLITFPKQKFRPKTAQRMAREHENANIAILTGAGSCRLTVVDIDDPALLPAMIARFGETPMQVGTPKGGVHLYYQSSGERSVTGLDGLKVDVRGIGGIIVAPPSVRRCEPFMGEAYRFVRGRWEDLRSLPALKSGSLSKPAGKPAGTLSGVETGNRNDQLFKRLMRESKHCDDLPQLQDCATTLNDQLQEPLPEAEALRIAESVWDYVEKGKNWCGGGGIIPVRRDALDLIRHSPDAKLLYLELLSAHTDPGKVFAVALAAMERAQCIPGWSEKRYRAARQALVDAGILVLVKQGGKHGHDPSLYRLA